ncbi:TVP38/TMEM64 family protein, partial [Parageobacillus sp. SY1]
MDIEAIKQWFTLDNALSMLEQYRSFGVFPGIAATLLESFFPVLPMFVFVMANAAAFGLWKGFL